jgi:hypothetical protein
MHRMLDLFLAGFLISATFASTAQASPQADICYGPTIPFGVTSPSTSSTVFSCPLAGNHTLLELANLGWIPVQLIPVVVTGGQADQLVIQHP